MLYGKELPEKKILMGELMENISAHGLLTGVSCYIKYPLIYPLGSKKWSSPRSHLMMIVLSLYKFWGKENWTFLAEKHPLCFLKKIKSLVFFAF